MGSMRYRSNLIGAQLVGIQEFLARYAESPWGPIARLKRKISEEVTDRAVIPVIVPILPRGSTVRQLARPTIYVTGVHVPNVVTAGEPFMVGVFLSNPTDEPFNADVSLWYFDYPRLMRYEFAETYLPTDMYRAEAYATRWRDYFTHFTRIGLRQTTVPAKMFRGVGFSVIMPDVDRPIYEPLLVMVERGRWARPIWPY